MEIKANKDPNLNDTWYVRYTTNGDDPTGNTATEAKDDTTIALTQPCTLRVVTRGTVCPTHFSDETPEIISEIFVPAPVITFTGTDNNGTATITCEWTDAKIYYTADGSEPDQNSTPYNSSFSVTAGTTIKAITYNNGYVANSGFTPGTASNTYIPGGDGNSGVFGTTVLLDDREDHSWSYYSDGTQPIHSLNPADVKITYYGNGTNNISTTNGITPASESWTEDATTVQVSYNETENTFIYLKTLERANADGTGNCAYTTIPNPFSVRPTYQYATGNQNKYCGFYGWRVKSVTGGSIQNYAVGATIPAETEIQFIPAAEYGMEVELEALWARAYVGQNNLNANVTYERNFIQITSNTTLSGNGVSYPVTYTSVDPATGQGTKRTITFGERSGGWTSGSNYYHCQQNTKFENVNVASYNTNTYLSGEGHDLIIGRGVTGNVNTIQGSNNSPNGVNYKLRIESGTYTNLYFASADCSGSGQNKVTSILGSDYDRASNNNSLLTIQTEVKISTAARGGFCQGETNYGREIAHITVRSGSFQSGYPENGNTGNGTRSFYICDNASTNRTVGRRVLIVEGGEFLNIAGGMDPYNSDAYENVYIRIKGGHVKGSIYGAAAQYEANGDRRFVITGGTINGWIAGGCNGTATTGGELHGNTYIYLGGNSQVVHTSNDYTIQSSKGGNIFGAGSGINGGTTVGRVNNSTVVIADNTEISRDVYGGGNYGYVTTGTGNKSDIYVLGGKVKGSVFGGSNQQQGQIVNINMKDGVVEGNLYGGSNTQGTINYDVTMNITGGEIKGNVHGGGYGENTNVSGNVALTIGEENAEDGPTIGGDVYGGGALGKVNTSSNNNTTTITVNAGTIDSNVYGGGLGAKNGAAANVGTVTVDINGGKINKVFGCNNQNGAPQGSVTVNFNGGEAVDVYGGGNEADYTYANGPVVNITGGVVTNNVYGGGSKASVQKTVVTMTGGEVNNNVYAGAEGYDEKVTLIPGNKTVNMQGGTAMAIYGGSYTCLDKAYSFVNISGGHIKTSVFGSGYFGNMEGDCYIYIGENAIKNAPNNANNTDQLSTLNHENKIWIENNIYAGANWGDFNGTFGKSTITGKSNIYIDGKDYNMDYGKNDNYMIIGGGVYGSGTSSAAGASGHSVIVRNYGNMTYPSMTRSLKSIQQADDLILDNSNIDFVGQGDITSMDPTVSYGICNVETIRMANTTNIALSKPMDMVHKLGSYTCSDVYASNPTFTKTAYNTNSNNGIVINNGGYLMVCYKENTNKIYGELEGFFYMREPGDDAGINNEGYIFARPKLIPGNGESYVEQNNEKNIFINDGGFVDFESIKNTFDENGNLVPDPEGNRKAIGTAVQMPYTNRTDLDKVSTDRSTEADNNTDYRFWRYEPVTVPTVTREIVFVVKASEDASPTSTTFLTTNGSVQFPPSLGDNHKYYINSLTWGADGKDCNPAPYAKTTTNDNSDWIYYDYNNEGFATKQNPLSDEDLSEYYANPNSTFGFLMQFNGNFAQQTDKILDNESYASYYKDRANALAVVDSTNTTDLPQLDFLLTYSDRLSQNELWSEARIVIDEVDANGELKQRIYLNISVTTETMFGSDVETYVYASTNGDKVNTYTASLVLPTFMLSDPSKYWANFTAATASKSADFNSNVDIVAFNNVANSSNLALNIRAARNEDNTNGWNNMGNTSNPNQPVTYDFYTINNNIIGGSDGRKYTTIEFELQYDPRELAKVEEFKIGQKYLGDLTITMNVDNTAATTFDIIVHVYVTGSTKFYYLDGVAGKDGNSGMFPNEAKRTLNGIVNANGFTVNDPIFVVNGVEPKANGSLTWNADKFLNAVTVAEEDLKNYTEEELRQLSQVKVYRYPGSHPMKDGDTTSVTNGFYNGMYTGPIVTVPAGTQFNMHNVCLSGGSDLDNNKEYNPKLNEEGVTENKLKSDNPLISIAAGATASIENSSLVNNNNTSTTAKAGAIYNEGTLTVNGVHISNNTSAAESGKGTGVYQAGEMNLGNTQMITIADQIYLDNKKIMNAPHGKLFDGSKFSDILVYSEYTPIDTAYSGRVIVRYIGYEPSAPKAPYWKANLPERQSSILKSRKDATEESYESDKYLLNSTLSGFEKANGGDENVIPFITYKMKEQFDPISSSDIIMYTNQANLPVELLYFTAECMGEATQLQWSTASETNNEYFTIERSSDAVNYEEVARIQGAGTTSQRNDYSFMVDNNSTAITYYRLRQTDIDGKYEIFAPIAIQCQNNKAATEISIYPVPANDQVNIFSSNSPMTRIEIFSIMGAKVAEEPAEGNQTTLHIGNLATGVYAVKVFTEDGQVSNVRLIKK